MTLPDQTGHAAARDAAAHAAIHGAGRAETGGGAPMPPLLLTVWRGLAGRCPNCGKGKLFSGFLGFAPRCNVCGEDFSAADAGDGPAVFVMLFTGIILVGGALIVEILYSPPYWVHAVLWGPLAIILPLAMLRPLKGLLVALQFRHKAAEGRLVTD
jgi:uncharacterized protein (DUF983 family)